MAHFVLNSDDIDRFIEERTARLDSVTRAWSKRHLRAALLADCRCAERSLPTPLPDRLDIKRNRRTARRHGIAEAWFTLAPDCEEEVIRVLDWLAALPEIDPRLAAKRSRISMIDAQRHAERWHAQLAKSRKKIVAEDDPHGLDEILKLEDGWHWVCLGSPGALDYEGAWMRHCVGDGAYDSLRTRIYSLRDYKNHPHCTVEFEPTRRSVHQAKGHGNEEVPPKYRDAVERLLRYLKPERVSARLTEFVLTEDGRILRLSQAADWPEGTRVRRNLVLTGRNDVSALPDGLRVSESLVLANSGLRRLPRDLRIGLSLTGLALSPVEELPEGLYVRTLNLEDSLVKTIAPGTRVLKELTLFNSVLRELPEQLIIGQLLLFDGAALPFLPRDLEVAGCPIGEQVRGRLPETLVAVGDVTYTDMAIDGSEVITVYGRLSYAGWDNPTFPGDLTVHGTLDLKHALFDHGAPQGRVTVHGDLDLRGTDIIRLPEDWKVLGRVLRD
ncbi:PcfJ domain-containing protein [Magnetospira sp. QH-2]|uniref:PcfJ domain-containing protein n=1 Tax=Magnetospira sp. (strain QH-2) TaxID=1288970 RepID=UPI0003E80D20|nr:PcfJ domain-containing protein [Magnetospira sp. QH-2]CCQ75145.1 protein of unknown function [Magnetospira sp. QH-2]